MMSFKKLSACLAMALAVFMLGTPAQAGMVTTEQLQVAGVGTEFANVAGQREWIEEQLVLGGVAAPEAGARVAAMTDTEVAQIYQRIDEAAAGGDIILVAIIVVLVLELTGVINIFD
jgi:hypothetical protein